MKKKKWKNQKWLALCLAVICFGGTTAYFTAFDNRLNTAAVGRNTSEIEEDFPKPTPGPLENDPEYKKTVWVTNASSAEEGFNVDCYVRVALSYSDYDIGSALVLKNLDTVNWIYNPEDGYYYYKNVLEEGASTTPLFTGFSIESEQADTTYLEESDTFTIQIYEESIQAGSFADYQSAWRYYSSPLDMDGKVAGI